MPKRFAKIGAFSYVAHRAYVAQASSLHTALSLRPDSSHLYKMAVGAGCASPDFVRPPQTAPTHQQVNSSNLIYEGARVKSWMLGRDVNPAGRGDGAYYAQGTFSIGSVRPYPTTTPVGGWGNIVNNWYEGGCEQRFGPQLATGTTCQFCRPQHPRKFLSDLQTQNQIWKPTQFFAQTLAFMEAECGTMPKTLNTVFHRSAYAMDK